MISPTDSPNPNGNLRRVATQRTVTQVHALFDRPALTPAIAIEIVVPPRVARSGSYRRGRTDDDSDAVRERHEIYESQTMPALELFSRSRMLVQVDGNTSADVVEARILHELERFDRAGARTRCAEATIFHSGSTIDDMSCVNRGSDFVA